MKTKRWHGTYTANKPVLNKEDALQKFTSTLSNYYVINGRRGTLILPHYLTSPIVKKYYDADRGHLIWTFASVERMHQQYFFSAIQE